MENHQIGSTRIGPLWTFHALVANPDLGLSKVIQSLKWIVWIILKSPFFPTLNEMAHSCPRSTYNLLTNLFNATFGVPINKKTAWASPRFFEAGSTWRITFVKKQRRHDLTPGRFGMYGSRSNFRRNFLLFQKRRYLFGILNFWYDF